MPETTLIVKALNSLIKYFMTVSGASGRVRLQGGDFKGACPQGLDGLGGGLAPAMVV